MKRRLFTQELQTFKQVEASSNCVFLKYKFNQKHINTKNKRKILNLKKD